MESFKELSLKTWKDYEKIMGPKGGCGGCWCMSWRLPRAGGAWDKSKGEPNRRAMKKLVATGRAHGVLAYEGGEPVGWCSFGPKDEYPRLVRAKSYATGETLGVWSAPCFLVRKDKRGKGFSVRMLKKAMEFAKKRGAKVMEGYPATKTKAGDKLPAAFVWTGPEAVFKRCRFKEVQRLSWSRPVYRKSLRPRSTFRALEASII